MAALSDWFSITTASYRGKPAWLLAGLALALLCVVTASPAADGPKGNRIMNADAENLLPSVSVEVETRYVLEFPILLAVTLRNDSADTDFLDLPDLGLLQPLDSIAVELRPRDGGAVLRIGPQFETSDANLFRTELLVGQAKRMLIDLSQAGQPLRPGRYELRVLLFSRAAVHRASPAVAVEMLAPSVPERAEAARLRRLGLTGNAADSGSWQPFLKSNWSTVAPAPSLGEGALRQLALHLWLHRAAYGPEALAQLSDDGLLPFASSLLQPDAALLAYELLEARADRPKQDAMRASLLQRWPQLGSALDRIDRGSGLLRTLRQGYGAERRGPMPAGRRPYT